MYCTCVSSSHLKFSKSTVSLLVLSPADLSVTRNLVMNPGYPEHSLSNRLLKTMMKIKIAPFQKLLPVRMPLHDLLQHGGEEPTVTARLVLGATGHGVGDVTKYPVIVNQSREVWCFQHVDDIHKLSSICCVAEKMKVLTRVKIQKLAILREREDASGKETRLEKLRDGPMPGVALVVVEPGVLLLPQPGHHPLYVLLVFLLLILD